MSNSVVSIIGSGLNHFRARHEGGRNLPADTVVIMNTEDFCGTIGLSGTSVNVPTSAPVLLTTSPLQSRRGVALNNVGGGTAFIGGGSGMGLIDGYPLIPGGSISFQISALVPIYAIASGTSTQVRILELA